MNRPRLIVTEERRPAGLGATTWEQRQGYRDRNGARIEERAGMGMTAAELTKLMGASHVNHPDFKGRGYTLNPEPNLAGAQACVAFYKADLWSEFKRAFRWTA